MNMKWIFIAIWTDTIENKPNQRILLVLPGGTYSHIGYISEILERLMNKGHVIAVTCTRSIYSHISGFGFEYYELNGAVSSDHLGDIIKQNSQSEEEYQEIIRNKEKYDLLSIREMLMNPYKEVYKNIKLVIEEFSPNLIICDYIGPCIDSTRSYNISTILISSQLFPLGIKI